MTFDQAAHYALLASIIYGVPLVIVAIVSAYRLAREYCNEHSDIQLGAEAVAELSIFFGVLWPYTLYLWYKEPRPPTRPSWYVE